MEAYRQFSQSGVQGTLAPTEHCVLLDAASMNAWPRSVWSDRVLIGWIGFNAHHGENGLTTHGDARRPTNKTQGPLMGPWLADYRCTRTHEEMERPFHPMGPWLARHGRFARTMLVALDGCNVLSPERSEGRGTRTHTRQVIVKGQQEPATAADDLDGSNVLVLSDVPTRERHARKRISGFSRPSPLREQAHPDVVGDPGSHRECHQDLARASVRM